MCQWLWIMVGYAELVVVNHGVLCWVSGCESVRLMLSQWLWIIVSYTEPVVGNHDVNAMPLGVNHVVLFWASRWESRCERFASRCESLWIMMSQWLWNIVSYTKPVVVNHCVLCWDECVGIMVCYAESVIVYHCVLCWAGCVWIMVCYADPVVGNHGVNATPVGVNHCELCRACDCESCVILCQ